MPFISLCCLIPVATISIFLKIYSCIMFVFEMLATIVTLLEGRNSTGLMVYPSGLIQNSAGRSSDRLRDGNIRPGDFA